MGVSAGFLKHHEKYGLLKPKVAESGYRYYEFHQAMLVVQCIRLQSIGFTSKEISDILNHTASIDMKELFEKKRTIIDQNYRLYKEMIQYLDNLTERQIPEPDCKDTEEWRILCPEPFYYVENASCGQFIGKEALYEVALRWNEYMPMVETCARFECLNPYPNIESIGNWHMGLRIIKSTAEHLNIFLNQEVTLVNQKKCLIYYVREKRRRNLNDPNKARSLILERPLAICQKHKFEIAGDIYSVQKFCSTAQEENYIQEMVMIPVKC